MIDNTLMRAAAKAEPPSRRINVAEMVPLIRKLRERGFSFRQAHAWLKEHGVAVQENPSHFTAAASKAISAASRQ